MPGRKTREEPAPLAGIEELDRLLEHRLRLALAVLLVRYRELTFARLKEVTGETDGNLGANLRRLEGAGYLTVRKEFVNRKPVSWYAPTDLGRTALHRHLDAFARIVAQAGIKAGRRRARGAAGAYTIPINAVLRISNKRQKVKGARHAAS